MHKHIRLCIDVVLTCRDVRNISGVKPKKTSQNSNISGEIYEKYIHFKINFTSSGNYC